MTTSAEQSNWKRKLAPLASFFGVQVIVQILSLATGLLIVRTMSKPEYAFYTLATTMQGAMAVLADSGVGMALSARGGTLWQNKRRLGELIQTALSFRRRFGLWASLVIGPLLFWLLFSQGASWPYALLVTATALLAASIALTHSVLVVVPRFHSRVGYLQKAELFINGLRLILIALACIGTLNAWIATAIVVLTLGLQNLLYRRWAAQDADLTASQNSEDGQAIWKIVRQQAPLGIYYCIQGQLTVFLIASFGDARQIADLGALGRIAVFFTVVTSVMSNIIIPRFASCQDYQLLVRMYKTIIIGYLMLTSAFLALSILFPDPFLWLLGSKYANLRADIPYVAFSACVSAMAGTFHFLSSSRGWIRGGWISIPITIGIQVVLLQFLDLNTIQGVLLLTSLPILPGVLPYIYQAYVMLKVMRLEQSATPA